MSGMIDKIKNLKKMSDKDLYKFYELVKKNADYVITSDDTEHGKMEMYIHEENLGTIEILFHSYDVVFVPESVTFQIRVVTDMDELALRRLRRKHLDTLRSMAHECIESETKSIDTWTKNDLISFILDNDEMSMAMAEEEFCMIFDKDAVKRADIKPLDKNDTEKDWIHFLRKTMERIYIRSERDDKDVIKYYDQ